MRMVSLDCCGASAEHRTPTFLELATQDAGLHCCSSTLAPRPRSSAIAADDSLRRSVLALEGLCLQTAAVRRLDQSRRQGDGAIQQPAVGSRSVANAKTHRRDAAKLVVSGCPSVPQLKEAEIRRHIAGTSACASLTPSAVISAVAGEPRALLGTSAAADLQCHSGRLCCLEGVSSNPFHIPGQRR